MKQPYVYSRRKDSSKMQMRTADKSEWTWFSEKLRIQKISEDQMKPTSTEQPNVSYLPIGWRTKRSHRLCPFLCAGACKHLPAFLCMSKPFICKILKLHSNKYETKHYSKATLKPSKGHLDLCVAHNFSSKKSLPNTCIDLKTCFQPYAMWGVVRFISVLFKPATGPWKCSHRAASASFSMVLGF